MGELSADGYGFALLDVRDLSEFLKERKCRVKKLLSYWDAHKQLFYDAVKGAKALPFYPLTVRSYEIRMRSLCCPWLRSSFQAR